MSRSTAAGPSWLRYLLVALVLFSIALLCLRFAHLDADFPNHSRWADDGAKFTDEGWYANAALNSAVWHHWYLPGDWAPATLMPVWPLMLHGVFAFGSNYVVEARALSVVFSLAVVLLAWWFYRREASSTLATLFFCLLAASAMDYAFSRLALLEAPLVAFALAALIASTYVRTGKEWLPPILIGLLLPLMIFTKTTGVFLVPAVLYPIALRFRGNWRAAVRPLLTIVVIAAAIYGCEQVFFAAHHRADIYDFLHHSSPRVTPLQTARKGIRFFYRGFTWIDPILFPIAIIGLIASFWMRELWRSAAWGAAVVWNVGYAAFIIYHFDGPPRYFSVMVPAVFLMGVMFTVAVRRRNAAAGNILVALCCIAFVWNSALVLRMANRPQYTEFEAMQKIRAIVLAHPESSHVMIGHGSAQTEFFTGLPTIDDTHGYMPEWQKMDTYHPGWVIIWSDEQIAELGDITSRATMVKLGEFPALDNSKRAGLELFQLQPKQSANSPAQAAPALN